MTVRSAAWLMQECSPGGSGSPAINLGEPGDVGAAHPHPRWAGWVPPELFAPRRDKLGHVRSLIGDEINPSFQ